MTDDYVQQKVDEALKSSANHRVDAQKLLITWAVRDAALLLGLTKPHLKAIVAGLVDHALRSKKAAKGRDAGPDHFSKRQVDEMVASEPTPAEKRASRMAPPPKSTERQANTMRRLADAFAKKNK